MVHVEVSQEMTAAGVYRLQELARELVGSNEDRAYLVTEIYMAMEYERLDSARKANSQPPSK